MKGLALTFLMMTLASCSAPSRKQLAGRWNLARTDCEGPAQGVSPTLKLSFVMDEETFQETLEETGQDGKTFAALSSGVIEGEATDLVLRRTSTDIYLGRTVKHLAWEKDSGNEIKVLMADATELALWVPKQCGEQAGRLILSRR